MSSTAGRSSKFGLLMRGEFEEPVLKLFADNPWLQGLHQHIGSQGITLDQLVLGVERLVGLAEKINSQARNSILQSFPKTVFSINYTAVFSVPQFWTKFWKILKKAGQKQVKSIDVGGGIPTDYHADEEKVNFSQAKIQTFIPTE